MKKVLSLVVALFLFGMAYSQVTKTTSDTTRKITYERPVLKKKIIRVSTTRVNAGTLEPNKEIKANPNNDGKKEEDQNTPQ